MAKKKTEIEKYAGLDLSDYEILQRTIRDTNRRLDRLAQNYGINSTIYKQNLAKVLQTFPKGEFGNRYTVTSKGVTHLSQNIKYDISQSSYLEKAKILTEKVETMGDVRRSVNKAVKEIYGIDIDDTRMSKTQQDKLITNVYKLKDSWDKIIREFYNVTTHYDVTTKPDLLLPLLRDLPFAKEHPEIIRMIEKNMSSFESKEGKGWNIVHKPKKSYNDMNNLILLTEALIKLLDKLEDDSDVYTRWLHSKGVKLTL